MAKKTANNAIDFNRLFALKDQIRERDALEEVKQAPASAPVELVVIESPRADEVVVPDVPEAQVVDPIVEVAPANVVAPTEARSSIVEEKVGPPMLETADESIVLRVGLPKGLHERVRAMAALRGKAPADFARDELERTVPKFDAATPLAVLARAAQAAAPAIRERARVDVRMQVPMTSDLHRRVVQLAALRRQTLAACMVEVFEALVPAME